VEGISVCPVRGEAVHELLELGVQEVRTEAVLLHFLERLIGSPPVTRHAIHGGHDPGAMTSARAVHVDRLVRGIVDQLQERCDVLKRRRLAGGHRNPMEHHPRGFDELLFGVEAVLLQVDHHLDAKRGERRVVATFRLSSAIVAGTHLAEVVDSNIGRRRARARRFAGLGVF
jgi:hypothetical protein